MADIAPDILSRAQAGDAAAYGEVVRFYRQDLLRVTYRFVGDYEDARDVLQQVFVKVWQNIHRWEPRAPFWSWLYRIAVNESLGWKKREKRRAGVLSPFDEGTGREPVSGRSSPLDDAEWHEVGRRVLDAIEELPQMQRATFILRFREELSVKETAAVLGCAEGTVKANSYHAIRRLRQLLGADGLEKDLDESAAL